MIETLTLADLCQPGSTRALSPDDRVGWALAIMAEQQLSAIVVAVDGCPAGIFTERDLLGLMARGDYDPEARLRDLMTPDPVTVSPQLTFAEGYARMAGQGFRHLVLTDGQGRLYGVLSETDFAHALGAEELMGPRTVADLMTRDPATLSPHASVAAALTLMAERNISSVVVAEGGRALGILSERDAIRLAGANLDLRATPLAARMSCPVHRISPDHPAHEASPTMQALGVRRLVVEDASGQLVGILTRRDLLRDIQDVFVRLLRRVVADQDRALQDARRQLSEQSVLRSLLTHAQDLGIVAADANQTIRFINGAALDILGLGTAAAGSLSLPELLTAAGPAAEGIAERLAALHATERLSLDLSRAADEGPRWLRLVASAIRNALGEREGYLLTVQDRTREHADTERLRAIFDQSPAGIALGDIQGRLVLANPALYEILGYREHPQELVGRHFSDLTLPEDRGRDIAQFARLHAGELPSYRIEKQYLRRDGTTARVEVTVSAIRELSGRMTASLAIVNDISALRLAQERLLEAQAIAHVGSWELDIADGTMIWSDETYRLLGYTPGEVEADEKRLLAAMPAADRPACAAALAAAVASPDGHYRFEHRVQGVDAVPRILLAEGRIARDAQGRPLRLSGTSLDVTRQRATEEALRGEQTRLAAERRRLANIIAGTRVGTWEWEVQTGATVFNARWAEIVGYRLEELAPTTIETWSRLAHPEDLPISNALLQRHFRGELDTYECEVRIRHKDGHWVWVFDQGRVVSWGPAGEPLLMSGIHQDISERHRAQECLRESEARLRAVFDNAPLGMALVGADGRVTLANQALGTFLGCAPERAVGMPVYGMSPPQERRADRIILADLIAGRRTSYRATKRYRRVDGRDVWGDLRVTLLPNRPGEPPSPLGMVEDVTDLYAANAQRQALEDALGRYTLQLEELVDVANLPLALPEQVCALLGLGCRSLGMTAALLGQLDSGHRVLATVRVDDPDGRLPRLGRRALDDILGGQGQPRVLGPERLTRSTLAAGFVSCIGVAFDCPHPDGPSDTLILTLWSTDPPLNLGGPERQILRLVAQRAAAVCHNERLQRSLMQAKERETIGHLASGVAHDFNNLLGVIDANLCYLESRLQDRSADPELAQVLEEIQSALGQAKVVTSGMLSLSRAGGVPLESVDLASTVADLVRILVHLLPPAIQLTVQIPADLKTRSSRGFLQAALLNLALNARDAMPNGGELRIAAQPGRWDAGARLAVGSAPAGGGVELSVTDTGAGMHPEVLARIFEPLFSTKATQRGHGLGLFMVQEFVSRSGAGLTVNSSPGEGTHFSLLLPPAGDAVAATR